MLVKQRWGNWVFDEECLSLLRVVERCTTSAEVLDWIFQVHLKGWIEPSDSYNLIVAFRELISPQSNLCSGGIEQGPKNIKNILVRS